MMDVRTDLDGLTISLEPGLTTTVDLARRMLVGRVITNKSLNKLAVKQAAMKAWGNPQGLQVGNLNQNTFTFTFPTSLTANNILAEGPWNVMGNLLSLQNWDPKLSASEVKFNLVQFWVQFHDLPMEFMTDANVRKLASVVGEPLELEDPKVDGCLLRTYYRARVLLNVENALVTGFWVPRQHLPKAWVSVKYEKLQGLCFKCGIFGHEQTTCKKNKAMSVNNPSYPRYSLALSVPPCRSLSNLQASSMMRNASEKSSSA